MMRGSDAPNARRLGAFETLVFIALALLSTFFSLNCAFGSAWSPAGDFGIEALDSSLRIVEVAPGSAAAAAGIRAGDAVDLKRVPADERGYLFDPLPARVGATMTLRVVHDGVPRTVVLVARRVPSPAPSPNESFQPSWIFFWAAPVVGMLFVICGAAIVLARPCAMTWGFYLYCLGVHPWMVPGPQEPLWLGSIVVFVYLMLYALGYAGLFVFVARLPHDRAHGGWRCFERAAPVVFALQFGITLCFFGPFLTAAPAPDPSLAFRIMLNTVYASVFVALCVKLRSVKGRERASVFWIVVGFAVGCLFARNLIEQIPSLELEKLGVAVWLASLVAMAVFPLSVAYAVVRHRALELGFLANRLLVYGFFFAAAAALFGVADWLLSTGLTLNTFAIGVEVALALALGMFLQAHHNLVVRLIDRFFLPQRYEAAVSLDRIRETIRRDAEASHEALTADVAKALDLASVAVFRRVDDGGFVRQASSGWGDGTLWHLLPDDSLTRMLASGLKVVALPELDSGDATLPVAAARPLVALTIRRRGRVEGAILVGPHCNGSVVDRDEVRGLAALFNDVLAA